MTRVDLVLWTIFIVILADYESKGQKKPDDLNLSDKTIARDKMLMVKLAKELLIDAKLWQRQIAFVREKRRVYLDYEVGLLMGKIREKYKRMMEIYMEAKNIYANKTNFTPPGRELMKPFHYIIYMEQIHTLEVDIDMLIRIIEAIPADTFTTTTPGQSTTRNTTTPTTTSITAATTAATNMTSSKRRKLRAEDDPHETETLAPPPPSSSADLLPKPEFQNEDELKLYNREQYERKNGHNINWTLDEYYGF